MSVAETAQRKYMSELASPPLESQAGVTKSAMKNTNARQRRSSARKVVISDNPAMSNGATMRTMNQTGTTENS